MMEIAKKIQLQVQSAFFETQLPPRAAGDPAMSEDQEDDFLDSVLGPPPPEEDGDTMELTTEAVLTQDDDGRISIIYPESTLTGMAGTITRITFMRDEPSLVWVIREGTTKSTLVMEEGKFHSSLYTLEGMSMDIAVHTQKLKNSLTPDGGELFMDYFTRVGGIATVHNRMTLRVTRILGEITAEGELK